MWIERPTLELVRHVALNMRDGDREEVFATRWSDDPELYAAEAVRWPTPFSWVAGLDEPIAMIGAVQAWPGFWSVFMFATPRLPEIGLPLTWFARKCMILSIYEANGHRGEAISMASHTEAHRWLETLGAKREATLQGYGKNGQDFAVFRWSREDVRANLRN